MTPRGKSLAHFAINTLPLLAFLLSYKFAPSSFKPVVFATGALVVSTIISVIASKILGLKIDKFNTYSNIGIVIFGLLTIFFNEPSFIKTKITVLNAGIASFLLYCQFKKDPKLQNMFTGKLIMTNENWLIFNKRLSIFFFFIAGMNEFIWAFLPEKNWVMFKVFGVLVCTVIFLGLNISFFLKHSSIPEPGQNT